MTQQPSKQPIRNENYRLGQIEYDACMDGETSETSSGNYLFYPNLQPYFSSVEGETVNKNPDPPLALSKALKLNNVASLCEAITSEMHWCHISNNSSDAQNLLDTMQEQANEWGIPTYEELLEKVRVVRMKFNENFLACDAKWSMFVVAAHHYCWKMLLSELPPHMEDGIKPGEIIVNLRWKMALTPKLSTVFFEWMTAEDIRYDAYDSLHILTWLFYPERGARLQQLSLKEFSAAMHGLNVGKIVVEPTVAFSVHSDGMPYYGRFKETLKKCMIQNSNSGFFAGSAELYWAILEKGFDGFIEWVEYPDDAITLYKDFNTACAKAPVSVSWAKSALGNQWKVVGVCEYIQSTECVKYPPEGNVVKVCEPHSILLHCIAIYGYHVNEEGDMKPVNAGDFEINQEKDGDVPIGDAVKADIQMGSIKRC